LEQWLSPESLKKQKEPSHIVTFAEESEDPTPQNMNITTTKLAVNNVSTNMNNIPQNPSKTNNKLKPGAIVGIVIGVLICFILFIYIYVRYFKNKKISMLSLKQMFIKKKTVNTSNNNKSFNNIAYKNNK
jgi:hypothetical protein